MMRGRIARHLQRAFRSALVAAAIAMPVLVMFAAEASAASAQRGLTFARLHCSQCHSIDKYSDSALRAAPPFRTLHKLYPVETLEEAFSEGIVTGHPSMPEYRLDPDQIGDLIAFMKSLE